MNASKGRLWLKILCITGCVLLFGVVLAAVLWYVNDFSIKLEMYGEPEITLECGDTYYEPGARTWFGGKFFLKQAGYPTLSKQGKVDTAKVGTYEVEYTSDILWYRKSMKRTVHVLDTIAPVLMVPELQDTLIPGTELILEGYHAYDAVDGDLTDSIEITREKDVITFSVKDKSGNQTIRQLAVHYGDHHAPELKLEGEPTISITAGTEFEEPGYTAIDMEDGNLTTDVQVEGAVNTYHAADYTITYTVHDFWGNEATVTRTVKVIPVPQPEAVTPGKKVIYLTFDDGPGRYTEQLLDVLQRYNVKVTFFVVNTDYRDLIKKEAEAGHTIAIHTASHTYKEVYASEEAYFADLKIMSDLIYKQTGVRPTMVRFPGGSSNTVSKFNPGIMTRLTQALTDLGYQYYDWNVDSNDAGGTTTADGIFENVINGVQKHNESIVLQHDIKGYSVEAVERIIIWGLENGYTFLPLEPGSPNAHHHLNN